MVMRADAYSELISSQLPALALLANLGWHYLTPAEALALRDGKEKNVILTRVLEPWLRAQNAFERKGQKYPFSDKNIQEALRKLINEPFQSLPITNEKIYDLLIGGTALPETVNGDTRSQSLHYIDWEHPENNVYHVTDEFSVTKRFTTTTRRPDVVLFVNGIPLGVMECKRATLEGLAESRDASVVGEGEQSHLSKPIAEAISQMMRNQDNDEIPHLFIYAQVLLAVHKNEAFYATTSTKKKFWSVWKEEGEIEAAVHDLINRPLSAAQRDKLLAWRPYGAYLAAHWTQNGERLPTAQDRLIYALLRPARLLKMIQQFIVYDNGVKKIARYQQFFAIQATLDRVAHLNAQGQRTGGVIWHTTGSGKSLTMVMLAKAIALHPNLKHKSRVILVTDRVDLDKQLSKTFAACGLQVAQATSSKHLVSLVKERKADVITTVINKFAPAAQSHAHDDGVNIFVLVDESHRSQYGEMHQKMQQVFPRACYIGFTGTPLTKVEKSTLEKFGDFIHKYPMRQAVADEAVVPLLYEGRMIEQEVNKEQLERWFERTTRRLTEEQKADLKRKMSRAEVISATDQRIQEIAYDVSEHYKKHWRGTGFKAQLAAPSKLVGYKYLRYLEENDIQAALIISEPDTREDHDSPDDLHKPLIQVFWEKMLHEHGSEEKYLNSVLNSFGSAEGIEIIVVVDKLLTGFDEPRNTVLYVDKPLKQHTLLQAVARVNRLAEGKEHGFIIDYRGVLGELNEAMNLYDALADYDAADIQGTFTDIMAEVRQLPHLHADLWAIFQGIPHESEAMERHLEPEDRRQQFYEALTAYAGALRVALSTAQFYDETPEKRITLYKNDLKFFHDLRQAIKLRYAEAIDYREYEDKVRKLLDEHIQATGTNIITELVNIFDVEKFDAEVNKLHTPAAKADTILNRMKRTITERMDEDPVFYRRFAELIEEVIQAYRQGRISEVEFFQEADNLLGQMRSGQADDQPAILNRYRHAPAYYRLLHQTLSEVSPDQLAEVAIQLEHQIETQKITDWVLNMDVQNMIRREMDDYLYQQHFALSPMELDMLLDGLLEVAKARSA